MYPYLKKDFKPDWDTFLFISDIFLKIFNSLPNKKRLSLKCQYNGFTPNLSLRR